MKWPELDLSQIVDRFISGGTPSTKKPEYWYGDIPWITGADFSDGEVVLGRRYINEEAIENSATNIVPAGSILMVTRTGVGKTAIAPVDIAISQDITGIVPKEGSNHRFIVSAIRHRMGRILSVQRGATIKGVTRRDVELLPIPVPAPSEQRRIVEILDQADALRKMCAEADAKAERILPTLFYKMFGDPGTIMTEKDAVQLKDCKADFQNGFACGIKDVPEGIPHLRMNNIDDKGVLNLDLVRTVPSENDRKKYRLQDGDVLFMSTNSEDKIGKACVFYPPSEGHFLFSNHLTRIRLQGSNLTPEYLASYLHLLWQKGYYPRIAKRWVNQASVSQQALGNINIAVPMKVRAKTYASATREFLKLQKKTEDSREQIDALFNTILYRAFSGDLTVKWRKAHINELLAEMEQQQKDLISSSEFN